ncbi:YbjN domain-containing protein [Phascolarctobacterium succinatutens]|jgi:hypothetical protein|uniref:YbjN domain-containing protein n=1 Tax=Phascolarctobacterium succinatutens TaxID=626940 RepID=UPI0026EE2C6F|nr:YbjN domain-containing protein [Phascolarctobacterium succinatutens]
MAEEIKDTEVKEETAEATTAAEKAEETLAMKKLTALKEFADAHEISGLQYLQINEANLLVNTRLLVEGQTLPLFIVVNNSVYTYLQAHLVTLTEEKKAATLSYLNELNNEFNMLKYSINPQGNVILTFSIPAGDDKFDPALVFALVDQLKAHLDTHYSALMEKIWSK